METRKDRPDLLHRHGDGTLHAHDHDHPHAGPAHTHEHWDSPGQYRLRELMRGDRDFKRRAFTVGIGGPVGSGKTALVKALCETLRDTYSLGVVTNDIFTREDGEFLTRHQALPAERILAVETGGCPHAAIREDVSSNLDACEELMRRFDGAIDLLLVESGGDNLAAHFGRDLADYTVYVIDVSGGDKIPRKGGPGITQSDLLVINKIDLAPYVGADLEVMRSDAARMRGPGPFLFAQVNAGKGIPDIAEHLLAAWREADPV